MSGIRRTTVAVAIVLALGIPSLAACGSVAENAIENAAGNAIGGDVDIKDDGLSIKNSDGTEVQIGGSATLPASWPADLPDFEGGSLLSVSASPDGSASAVWSTDQSAEDAVAAYDAQLTSAGFVRDGDHPAIGLSGGQYTGNGIKVSILGTTTADKTTLVLSAEPDTDSSPSPSAS